MAKARQRRAAQPAETSANHQVRAYLSVELYLRLQKMAETDERTHRDFMRWLIKREWERRNKRGEVKT